MPPAAAGDYKLNLAEAIAAKVPPDKLAESPLFKAFTEKCHAAGLSQKQYDTVVGEFMERSIQLQEARPQLEAADCTAALRQIDGWKTDADYQRQIGLSWNAGSRIFGAKWEGMVGRYGNDPDFVAGLAGIGVEMAEDTQPSPEAQAQLQDSLESLMASPAYLNASDPQHAAIFAKVTALQERVAGTRPVASGRTMSFKT